VAKEKRNKEHEEESRPDDFAACPFCDSEEQDDMVCCDQCESWIHSSCAGLTDDDLTRLEDDDEEYICENCMSTGKNKDTAATLTIEDDTQTGSDCWQCAACTYAENHENLLACMMCDTMRGVPGHRSQLSRHRLPSSSATANGQTLKRISVPEGKIMVLAFAMSFLHPEVNSCDAVRLRALQQLFACCYPIGVAEHQDHDATWCASPQLDLPAATTSEGEDRSHISVDFRQQRGFNGVIEQAPASMLLLDYFWLEKDYYNNRYGDRWLGTHLDCFFRGGRGQSKDEDKIAILPLDVPSSGNMLAMLRAAGLPHSRDERIQLISQSRPITRRTLREKNVHLQFMSRSMCEGMHPLVIATLECQQHLMRLDAGRIHSVQIERCDPDTPFMVFFRSQHSEDNAASALRRLCGSPQRANPHGDLMASPAGTQLELGPTSAIVESRTSEDEVPNYHQVDIHEEGTDHSEAESTAVRTSVAARAIPPKLAAKLQMQKPRVEGNAADDKPEPSTAARADMSKSCVEEDKENHLEQEEMERKEVHKPAVVESSPVMSGMQNPENADESTDALEGSVTDDTRRMGQAATVACS